MLQAQEDTVVQLKFPIYISNREAIQAQPFKINEPTIGVANIITPEPYFFITKVIFT